MKSKVFKYLAIIAFVFGITPLALAQEAVVDGVEYSIDEDAYGNTFAFISGYDEEAIPETLTLPAVVTINNKRYRVRNDFTTRILYGAPMKNLIVETNCEIPNSAFRECPNLETVKITGNVKVIEESAFKGCPKLYSVEISSPEYVSIRSHAFNSCKSLKTFYVPKNVGLCASAFVGSGLTTVTFEDEKWQKASGGKISSIFMDTPFLKTYVDPEVERRKAEAFKQLGISQDTKQGKETTRGNTKSKRTQRQRVGQTIAF